MTDLQTLFKTVDELSSTELKELYQYIVESRVQFMESESKSDQQPRKLGLHAHLGKAWMSEDFMGELPDSFWLGEE